MKTKLILKLSAMTLALPSSLLFALTSGSVGPTIQVASTPTLSITNATFPFTQLDASNMSGPETKTDPTLAYINATNTPLYLQMDSTLIVANNPVMTPNGASVNGNNYIPYTVSFTPCGGGTTIPFAGVGAANRIQIPATNTISTACLTIVGGTPGSLNFTRGAVASLPSSGLYSGSVSFTLSVT